MKRKFSALFPLEDKLYAVAEDGSAWRLLGDPLAANWTRLPDLPERESPLEEEVGREATKPKTRGLSMK